MSEVVPAIDLAVPNSCPPHRWLIQSSYQAGGNLETWTCSQCGEVRHKDRRALEAQPRQFTSGATKKRMPPGT